MAECILHIGAHRTATTSLQKHLRDNADRLGPAGISALCPPESRVAGVRAAVAGMLGRQADMPLQRWVISEENLLGTMEHNLSERRLYPQAASYLQRLDGLIKPDVVMLSIRETGAFWTSSVLFCLSKTGLRCPHPEDLAAIALDPRGWCDVVEDVASVFPEARIVVRAFDHMKDNPKRFLKVATGWPEWNDTKLNRRAQNARPAEHELVSLLLDRRDFEGLGRLGDTPATLIFSAEQRQQMYAAYQRDLDRIAQHPGVDLLVGSRKGTAGAMPSDPEPQDHKTVFLHIGRTGETMMKSLIEADPAGAPLLHMGQPGDTLISSIKAFGRNRKLAFFFRDPEERFIAGFLSRRAQGRPVYDVNWTTAEAVAFSFFETPQQLAEALSAPDERLKSAARFAMTAIVHLKYNQTHYLHSVDALRYESDAGNIVLCCETGRIGDTIGDIMSALDLSGPLPPASNWTDPAAAPLSDLGRRNLRQIWSDEFRIYEACRDMARDLGYGT